MVSLIIPCYNEEKVLPLFFGAMKRLEMQLCTAGEQVEFIFVDDGSSDGTLTLVKEQSASNKYVHYISFSRNFGKEAAMLAGYRAAKGDYVAAVDADLQHPLELIPVMLKAIKEEGYDCCATKKKATNTGLKSALAKTFYHIINEISTTHFEDGACDFQLMNRNMLNAVLQITEHERFTKGILGWVGFKTKWIEYTPPPRQAGESKWSLTSLFAYAFTAIFSFSFAPAHFPLVSAATMAVVYAICSKVPFLAYNMRMNILFIMQILILLSVWIQMIYTKTAVIESKNRPVYIVAQTDVGHEPDAQG